MNNNVGCIQEWPISYKYEFKIFDVDESLLSLVKLESRGLEATESVL
jgi:hypothetical protein